MILYKYIKCKFLYCIPIPANIKKINLFDLFSSM